MTKSELAESLSLKLTHLFHDDVAASVEIVLETMVLALVRNERIEIRGFGTFDLRKRGARMARNPKTGERAPVQPRQVPHFKPGKELRDRVRNGPNGASPEE